MTVCVQIRCRSYMRYCKKFYDNTTRYTREITHKTFYCLFCKVNATSKSYDTIRYASNDTIR